MPDGSAIVNTTSVTAYKGNPTLVDYSSTKGAIVAFTRSLATQLLKRGIRVNAVSPNWVIDTLKLYNMDPSIGTPVEVVAQAYVQALEGSMNGEVIEAID